MLEAVEAFLKDLHFKIGFRANIFFMDARLKNRLALAELREMGFKSDGRIRIILGLTPANYLGGPTADTQNTPPQGDLWEFGVMIKPKLKKRKAAEYYIKVQLGTPDSNVICISFHPAEFKIDYPKLSPYEA